MNTVLAIAFGSIVGGLLRWGFVVKLNGVFQTLPLGTLVSNLIAGYIAGFGFAFFSQAPNIAPEWRLLLIAGFCGGLSTFSTFSLEVVGMFQRGEVAWAFGTIAIHVTGSLTMTFAGILSLQWIGSLSGSS